MGRVFIKGDCHSNFVFLPGFCKEKNTTKEDILILLGDVGLNYFLDSREQKLKRKISSLPITLLCVHGNHEERPSNILNYKIKYFEEYGCYCWYEEKYPNILFPKNGTATIKGKKCLFIGGAYSVDKYYRLNKGYQWFESEQLTEEEKNEILSQLKENNSFDYIFTHTAPLKYEPTYLFLDFIDQSKVDKSMEIFLQEVLEKVKYKKWYFAHYHDDKELEDNFTICYHSVIEIF